MIYIEHQSQDAAFWFGLERDLMTRQTLTDDVFLLWRVKPTVMIGRYQNIYDEIDLEFTKQSGMQVTRRLTGGGAIYTDPGSFQFSFINSQKEKQIDFSEFVAPVLSALRKIGLLVQMSGRNDLLIDGKKFCGNAQYRANGRVLHHGSILFDTDFARMARVLTPQKSDPEKLAKKGVQSVRARVTNLKEYLDKTVNTDMSAKNDITADEFKNLLLSHILSKNADIRALNGEEISKIESIHAPLFISHDWVFNNKPAFKMTKSARFSGGKLEICFNLKDYVICDCQISGDFFLSGEIEQVANSLNGCKYDKESVRAALSPVLREQTFYQITITDFLECLF